MNTHQRNLSASIDPVKLDLLAEVAVKVGLSLQEGQDLLLTAPAVALPLVRNIAEHAFHLVRCHRAMRSKRGQHGAQVVAVVFPSEPRKLPGAGMTAGEVGRDDENVLARPQRIEGLEQAGLEEAASFQASAEDIRWHFVPPWNSFMGRFRSFGSPVDRLPSQDDASGLAIGPYQLAL